MKQIRNCLFETNSSSVHSLSMVSKNDYSEWVKGNMLITRHSNGAKLIPYDDEMHKKRTEVLRNSLLECVDDNFKKMFAEINDTNYMEVFNAYEEARNDLDEIISYSKPEYFIDDCFYEVGYTYTEYMDIVDAGYYETFKSEFNDVIAFGYYGHD